MICWTWPDRCVPGELPVWLLIWFGETIQNAQLILETDFLDHCLFPANSKTLLFFLLQYPIPTCSGRPDPITTYCDRKVALSPAAMLGLLVQDGFAITGGKPISRYFPLPVVWLQKGRETGGLSAGVSCLSGRPLLDFSLPKESCPRQGSQRETVHRLQQGGSSLAIKILPSTFQVLW